MAVDSVEGAEAVGASPEFVNGIKLFFQGTVKEARRFFTSTYGEGNDVANVDSDPDDGSSSDSSDSECERAGRRKGGGGGGGKKKKGMKKLKNTMLSLGMGKKKKNKRGKTTISQAAIAEGANIPDNEVEEPAGLASLGACPLLSPLVLGEGIIPVATLEVCTGKYCRRNGAYAIAESLKNDLPSNWPCETSAGRCIGGKCRNGVNIAVQSSLGYEKFAGMDLATARSVFIPMALRTNEINGTTDEGEGFIPMPGKAPSSAAVSQSVDSDAPPGYMPKIN